MVKVSVIIPVFNEEKYIGQCLDSVINQTLTDIEIICVDDGSDDNSLSILYDYQKKDNRIKVISQENRGLSTTRNVALKQVTGDYVAFVDADDYLNPTTLDELYKVSVIYDVDFTISKLLNFDNKTGNIKTTPYYEMEYLKRLVGTRIFNFEDVKDKIFEMCVTAPGKLFKKEFIMQFKFEDGLLFEDNLFFIKCMLSADRVYFYDSYVYNRRLHDSSITSSYFSKFSDVLIIYDKIEQELKKFGVYDELKVQMFNRKCRTTFMRFTQVEDKDDFFRAIKSDFISKRDTSILEKCSQRSRCIYESALDSDTPDEFELKVKLYDMNIRNGKLDLKNNRLEIENQRLKIENENLLKNQKELLDSNSWKITEPLRNFKKFLK